MQQRFSHSPIQNIRVEFLFQTTLMTLTRLVILAIGITDWNKGTDADFKAASAFLGKVHANVRTYWADGAELSQLMSSGEVLISWAWSETPVTMQAEGHPVK